MKKAAIDTISQTTIITKTIKAEHKVRFKYPQMNNVMRIIKEYDLKVINTDFCIKYELIFAVIKNKANVILNTFQRNHELIIKHIKPI